MKQNDNLHYAIKNIQHRILPFLFANTLFKCHSIGSGFTKFGYENYIGYSFEY
jgi:hypothetical protein